jgi:hypothetical protein
MRGLGTIGLLLELLEHLPPERTLGQHALDRQLDHPLRVPGHQLGQRLGAEPAGIAGVAVVPLVGALLGIDGDAGGVDHDHVVAGVDVGGVDGLVLAAEHPGHLGGQAAEDEALGVDHVPGAGDIGGLGREGAHPGVPLHTGSGRPNRLPGPAKDRQPTPSARY